MSDSSNPIPPGQPTALAILPLTATTQEWLVARHRRDHRRRHRPIDPRADVRLRPRLHRGAHPSPDLEAARRADGRGLPDGSATSARARRIRDIGRRGGNGRPAPRLRLVVGGLTTLRGRRHCGARSRRPPARPKGTCRTSTRPLGGQFRRPRHAADHPVSPLSRALASRTRPARPPTRAGGRGDRPRQPSCSPDRGPGHQGPVRAAVLARGARWVVRGVLCRQDIVCTIRIHSPEVSLRGRAGR